MRDSIWENYVVDLIEGFGCLLVIAEVMKVLRAKKYAKTKQQQQPESAKSRTVQKKPSSGCAAEGKSDKDRTQQVSNSEPLRIQVFLSCAFF